MTKPAPFTTAQLEALRKLREAATPGEWGIYSEECADIEAAKKSIADVVDGTPNFSGAVYMLVAMVGDDFQLSPAVTGCGAKSERNALLIASAVNVLPQLIDELLAANETLEKIRDANQVSTSHHAFNDRVVAALMEHAKD